MSDRHPGGTTPPFDDHPDELLSAHLDGELEPAFDRAVVDHLAACRECAEAADDLRGLQAALRGAPVAGGTAVVDGVIARRHRLLRVGVSFVGVASMALVALGVTSETRHPVVAPDLEHLAAVHGTVAGSVGSAGASGLRRADVGMKVVDDVEGHYAAPIGLIGSAARLSRQAVYDTTDMTAVVYGDRSAAAAVSVFQQPGSLDWDSLPDGETEQVDDRRVWFATTAPDDRTVAVTEVGDLVVTVVGDDRGPVLTVVAGLPDVRRRSTWDRVHDACQRYVAVFTLGN